jgi:hypothetical protein
MATAARGGHVDADADAMSARLHAVLAMASFTRTVRAVGAPAPTDVPGERAAAFVRACAEEFSASPATAEVVLTKRRHREAVALVAERWRALLSAGPAAPRTGDAAPAAVATGLREPTSDLSGYDSPTEGSSTEAGTAPAGAAGSASAASASPVTSSSASAGSSGAEGGSEADSGDESVFDSTTGEASDSATASDATDGSALPLEQRHEEARAALRKTLGTRMQWQQPQRATTGKEERRPAQQSVEQPRADNGSKGTEPTDADRLWALTDCKEPQVRCPPPCPAPTTAALGHVHRTGTRWRAP